MRSILFICTLNSIRSPMAAALMRATCMDHASTKAQQSEATTLDNASTPKITSAGVACVPVNNFATIVLTELGIDISSHKSRTIAEIKHQQFDLIVTLSQVAQDYITQNKLFPKATRLHWLIPDPSHNEGSRKQMLDSFREIRDQIKDHIDTLVLKK